MPSTVVHLAFGGLVAAALLAEFDRRALAVVLVVVAVPDLDSFLVTTDAGHRTVFHNLWVAVVPAALLLVDLRVREESLLRRRWGARGVRVAWVALLCYLVAHLALDIADGYVNLLWPVFDQFYTLDGSIELSSRRGVVNTFSDGGVPLLEARGTSSETQITTGVDPGEGQTERLFPVVRAGWQLVVLVAGIGVTALRLAIDSPD
jgi:pimeloyl-ACP methyl ester carboxylesterase